MVTVQYKLKIIPSCTGFDLLGGEQNFNRASAYSPHVGLDGMEFTAAIPSINHVLLSIGSYPTEADSSMR